MCPKRLHFEKREKQLKTAMNLGRLCQIILKSSKDISGYGQLAQHAIFAYHMVRQTPLIALPPLGFPECHLVAFSSISYF